MLARFKIVPMAPASKKSELEETILQLNRPREVFSAALTVVSVVALRLLEKNGEQEKYGVAAIKSSLMLKAELREPNG